MVVVVAPRCQGLCVGTHKPCRITKHLNADGFCKLHVPDARQCRGTAKKTGSRCRIKWDLNDDQLCQFHTGQVSDAAFPKDSDGSATAMAKLSAPREGGEPTKLTINPTETNAALVTAATSQCRGTAKSTGQRCRIKSNLNDAQLCKHHAGQTPTIPITEHASATPRAITAEKDAVSKPRVVPTTQCRGTAMSTGTRCQIKWDLNDEQLCKYHAKQTLAVAASGRTTTSSPRAATTARAAAAKPRPASASSSCRGVAASTGARCRIHWDLNTDGYCKWHKGQHQLARL